MFSSGTFFQGINCCFHEIDSFLCIEVWDLTIHIDSSVNTGSKNFLHVCPGMMTFVPGVFQALPLHEDQIGVWFVMIVIKNLKSVDVSWIYDFHLSPPHCDARLLHTFRMFLTKLLEVFDFFIQKIEVPVVTTICF